MFNVKLRSTGDDPLRAELTVPVVIDRRFSLPVLAEMPAMDGEIDEWPSERTNTMPAKPLLLGNLQGWQGPGDGSAEFFARQVGNRAYVAARVTDDNVMAGDKIELLIDPRGVSERTRDQQYQQTGLSITATAPDASGNTTVTAKRLKNGNEYKNVEAAARRTKDGYDVEFAIPLNLVREIQGSDWHSLQGTVVLHDVDEQDGQPTQVVWRGTQRLRQTNTGFGHFVRDEK